MTDSDKAKVELKVGSYFAQVALVGKLPMSLKEYLKSLSFTDEQVAYGIECSKLITRPFIGDENENR